MDEKITTLDRYFEEQIRLCGERKKALLADDRTDEATFEGIKTNIFDIFRTVLSAAVNHCAGEPAAIRDFFLLRLENIPTSWKTSLEAATAHNDTAKARLEQIKLGIAAEIGEAFARIWGEAE